MNKEYYSSIGISWWNTSLSPLGKCRANEEEKTIAAQIISLLVNNLNIDILACGEVTTNDLHFFSDSCSLTNYEIFDGTLKEGRLLFDTGLIYNKYRLKLLNSKNTTSDRGTQSLKIAQRVDFVISETNELLHIFIIHWPSRLWCYENSAKRDFLGIRLNDFIKELKNEYSSHYFLPPQIIILGDFNDEPFNDSIANDLLATRDRTLAKQDDLFFYNPFWRHLGETKPHSFGVNSNSICGTYFHKTGEETKWRTFDQIIVSSSFLRDDRWYIEEKDTQILYYPPFDNLLVKKVKIFDHRPILSYIKRKLNGVT